MGWTCRVAAWKCCCFGGLELGVEGWRGLLEVLDYVVLGRRGEGGVRDVGVRAGEG